MSQPFYLAGYLPWAVCVTGPSELSIGCERHSFAEWSSDLDKIAARHRVDEPTLAKVKQVIAIAEAWHNENPIQPVAEPAPAVAAE